MLYGFGDSVEPLPETVELVKALVLEYIVGIVRALCVRPFASNLHQSHCYLQTKKAQAISEMAERSSAARSIKGRSITFAVKLERHERKEKRIEELVRADVELKDVHNKNMECSGRED